MRLLVILTIVLMASMAQAAPYLVCDPQEGVEEYKIIEGTEEAFVPAQSDGSISMDLKGFTNGLHVLEISACNIWGCSDPAPFEFTKAVPATPGGLGIIP